jgi:hypothetical protein
VPLSATNKAILATTVPADGRLIRTARILSPLSFVALERRRTVERASIGAGEAVTIPPCSCPRTRWQMKAM